MKGRAAVALSIVLAAFMLALPGAALAAKHSSSGSAASGSSASGSATSGSGSGGAGLVSTSSTSPITGGVGAPGSSPAATATQTETTATVAGTSTSSGGGISGGSAIAIAAAAVLIIVGIGYAIMRDARRRTPRGPVKDSIDRTPGSQRPPKARKLSSAERKRRKRGRAPRRR